MTPFKTCTKCKKAFSVDEILDSGEIEPTGMQFLDDDFQWNMYYFSHTCDGCGSTFVIPVKSFLPFITEHIPDSVLSGSDRCERHCMKVGDLQACRQPCYYAPFRRFLLSLLERRRRTAPPTT